MEEKRQRIDEALVWLHNDMWVNVAGKGEGKIIIIYAYSVDVRVKLMTGEIVDTTAFEVTPMESDNASRHAKAKRPRKHEQGRLDTGAYAGAGTVG